MNKSAVIIVGIALLILLGGIIFAQKNQPSSPAVTPTPVTKQSQITLSQQEESQILTAARAMVQANTEAGYKYSLSIKKHVGDYVRVDVTPAEGEMIDPAQVILEKKDGSWQAVTFGTSFPDLYDKIPALFK